ncbi:MAG: glycosyltransferase family 4 protein [Chloroflexi bacterium]|nr:glycosyltransferase family 4 protein [Chloroflexota bacterium]
MATQKSFSNLKRILVLSNLYYPYVKGGYELQCKTITDELVNRGYDIQVLTSDWQASEKKIDGNIHRLLRIREAASQHPLYRRWQHLQWALISRINHRIAYRLMQTLDPDIVFAWNMGRISLGPLAAAQELGLPLVFNLSDYWLLQRHQELCLEPNRHKKNYRLFIHGLASFDSSQFPYLLTLSEVLKQQYIKVGLPGEHISVIPWGLPSHLIQDMPHSATQRSTVELLYAGRLSKEKGVDLAIRTVAMLNQELASELDRPVHLDIVGAGDASYERYLQELVVSLDLQQAVRFVGKLSQDELIARYKRYDAVLMPHIWVEPFGGVSIEAMAQGTCVIASDHGGPAEIITHGKDGLLVPPEDPSAMARAVIGLVQNQDLKDYIRHAAIATVRERYSLDKVGDQVEAYLNAALADHHQSQER